MRNILTGFLNGEQDDEINSDQSIGFVTKGNKHNNMLSQTFYLLSQASNCLDSGTLCILNSPRVVF